LGLPNIIFIKDIPGVYGIYNRDPNLTPEQASKLKEPFKDRLCPIKRIHTESIIDGTISRYGWSEERQRLEPEHLVETNSLRLLADMLTPNTIQVIGRDPYLTSSALKGEPAGSFILK